ncbi:putative ATPase/DNA-binding CsgD family transcriptional regulator [Streptomyces phaeochromogenes]|uniref:ATP-binding protein n=1 Tax=Streptomyces phaeochromogenes TaxID=1923 RepID=UPI002791CE17|nr:LuxR C-terminal-related transcriptional regulator [Streptomyces phaeochromogenes]MDQ0946512.1 putative ATPase/DNA-binding CsgD family transcriptional regulator [Streptomyces phaeochromogenes]
MVLFFGSGHVRPTTVHNLNVANQRTPPEVGISVREAEVLAALGEHLTNAEIGARLFISIRTVESHVSALLRKLQVADRRALAAVSANLLSVPEGAPAAVAALPSPLTPFVGRVAERAALTKALREHRLVTAVGPGGVGKTRLALSVAAEANDRFADGVWYVNLVPVTDPLVIAAAIADALGLGESAGRSATDNVLGWMAGRETLLVLDNCEHLLDGVVVLLERLLAGSPGLAVLATSRARLLVPFEWVFAVPGMSVEADGGGPGDAVELFVGRASAGGSLLASDENKRIAAVCRRLDGMALAIELAAARFASLGLDGLEAGLADRLRLLTGGPRIDDRHRSLRSTLDWSYALLAEPDQAVLRRISVFAGPFTAGAAATVLAGWPPEPAGSMATILAGLADQSLLIAIAEPSGTRYRVLETIRQYGADRLEGAGESDQALSRHLNWCLDESADLQVASRELAGSWRGAFDRVADELRGALAWAAGKAEYRPEGYRLAIGLAGLAFTRGMPGESQRRYEQAAELAADDLRAADALRCAAGAAESRHFGNDALRLRRSAADASIRAGDRVGAAGDLARNAEFINRAPGLIETEPAAGEVEALIAEAWMLADSDPAAQARLLIAEACNGAIADPATLELIKRALTLARRIDDPLIESAALDQLTAVQLGRGEVRAAAASAMRRTELLAPLQVTATTGLEFFDGFGMADHCAVAAGDLRAARKHAERLRDLPFYREEGHLATRRMLVVTALAGDWDETITLAERFREGWDRAGRPRAGNLRSAAYAAATVHGLRGDDDARAVWLDIIDALGTPGRSPSPLRYGEFFDALLLLHRGQPQQAVQVLHTPPGQLTDWYDSVWRTWYAAVWAEAAALSGHQDAAARIQRARLVTMGNPIATAIVDRAAILASGDVGHDGLTAAAAALEGVGCRYQWARALVFLGGEQRARGESELARMGATAMVWPPQ